MTSVSNEDLAGEGLGDLLTVDVSYGTSGFDLTFWELDPTDIYGSLPYYFNHVFVIYKQRTCSDKNPWKENLRTL